MGSLALPDGVRTKLWYAIVSLLQNNPVLSSVVDNWLTWTNEPTDSQEIPYETDRVNIRLTPRIGPMNWWTPDSMIHDFAIHIEATIPGSDITDMLNLQESIENAIYPPDHNQQIQISNTLRNIISGGSGATTGLIRFSGPLYDTTLPMPNSNNFYAIGDVTIEVRRNLNL